MDHYKTLGLAKSATPDEIKIAYRRLAMKYHPDRNSGDNTATAETIFKEINKAYECLSDLNKKQKYDNASPFTAAWEKFYDEQDLSKWKNYTENGRTYKKWAGQPQLKKNKAIHIVIQITLAETLSEQIKFIEPKVQGEIIKPIKIVIPKGVTHGHTIKYPEVGSNKIRYAERGDILVEFVYTPDLTFSIVKDSPADIECDITISAFDAILGTKIPVKTIDGLSLVVTIPKGSQPGTRLKISKKGLYKKYQTNTRGNMFINLIVKIPTLSTKEEKIIRKFTTKE